MGGLVPCLPPICSENKEWPYFAIQGNLYASNIPNMATENHIIKQFFLFLIQLYRNLSYTSVCQIPLIVNTENS